jgi:hypothetical protein
MTRRRVANNLSSAVEASLNTSELTPPHALPLAQ